MNPQRLIRPALNAFKAGRQDIDRTIENMKWVVDKVKWEYFFYGLGVGGMVAIILIKFVI